MFPVIIRPMLEPLNAPSLIDMAANSIRESILSGQLEMGARLLDNSLANDLSVSRGTVRGALNRLVDEGMVEDQARQGYFVRRLGPEDVIDLYNLRIGLEPIAARLCVRRNADLSSLEQVLERMRVAADAQDLTDANRADSEFHTEMVTLSANQHLSDLYRSVRDRLRLALLVDNRGNEDFHALYERHVPLLDALRSGDELKTADAAHAHIVGHVDEVLRRLGADPGRLLPPA